jgi:hypothetical protein
VVRANVCRGCGAQVKNSVRKSPTPEHRGQALRIHYPRSPTACGAERPPAQGPASSKWTRPMRGSIRPGCTCSQSRRRLRRLESSQGSNLPSRRCRGDHRPRFHRQQSVRPFHPFQARHLRPPPHRRRPPGFRQHRGQYRRQRQGRRLCLRSEAC